MEYDRLHFLGGQVVGEQVRNAAEVNAANLVMRDPPLVGSIEHGARQILGGLANDDACGSGFHPVDHVADSAGGQADLTALADR